MFNKVAYQKEYYEKNRLRLLEDKRGYYLKNGESIRAKRKKYVEENREKILLGLKQRYRLKKDEYIKRNCINKKKRRKTDPYFRFHEAISFAVYRTLKGNKYRKSAFSLLDYSEQQLREHIELQFKEGMNWGNYGKWHLDHIRPVASFNIQSIRCADFKKCWALTNLQPLWADENIRKRDKYENPNITPGDVKKPEGDTKDGTDGKKNI